MDFASFDEEIGRALDSNKRVLDSFKLTEEQMWADLSSSIGDSRTEAQAQAEFLEWRSNARDVGEIAVRGVYGNS